MIPTLFFSTSQHQEDEISHYQHHTSRDEGHPPMENIIGPLSNFANYNRGHESHKVGKAIHDTHEWTAKIGCDINDINAD